jgi:hypothetical protein
MGHTRSTGLNDKSVPQWAIEMMYNIMGRVNRFADGIIGVEFVLDTQLLMPIFHDMYWSLRLEPSIAEKFHAKLN